MIIRGFGFCSPQASQELPMINIVDLTQHYGVRPILSGVNLQVPTGTLAAILGPNGMGKSTLLAAVAGVLTPQKGYVEINGRRRKESVEAELEIRRQTVYLPDRPWLPAQRTGREFLLGVGKIYGISDEPLFDHINRVVRLFDLEALAHSPISSYSAGQQKKIALCSALVTRAEVLLLDEPFSGGLDPSGILALKSVLRRLTREHGATVLMTTPVPEIAADLADQLVILRDGAIAVAGSLDDLRQFADCEGDLSEVLERLVSPETLAHLEQYFAETP
ncbi:MAG: ABC transporter ATP-binding protein [Planctomycetaceae bacterium]|nr:ABC transporter ATP-binding protein [Planctomycetaceae bacterium]